MPQSWRLTPLQRLIRAYLQEHGRATSSQIAEAIGHKAAAVGQSAEAMREKRLVEPVETDDGPGWQLRRFLSSTSEARP